MDMSALSLYKQSITVTQGDDYTHALLFNCVMPNDSHFAALPRHRIVGFAHEPLPLLLHMAPPAWVDYVKRFVGTYYVGDEQLGAPFRGGQLFLMHNQSSQSSMKQQPVKTRFCSLVLSHKKMLPGHRYRHELADAILQTNLPVDIYGRGCDEYRRKYPYDTRIRGAFPQTPEAVHGVVPYADYNYSICIENSQSGHYFTEKIINPLLYGARPLYLGCQHIEDYLPQCSVPLTGRVEEDIALLRRLQGGGEQVALPSVEWVLDRTNLFHHLDRIFDDISKIDS